MTKKVLLVVFLTLVCSSCYIRTGLSTVAGYGTDVNWEIETYPVESGIGDGYGPNKMLVYSDTCGLLAAFNGDETSFYVTSNCGKNWKRRGSVGNLLCRSIAKSKDRFYGCFLSTDPNNGGVIMMSNDVGKTWETILDNRNGIFRFDVQDDGTLVALLTLDEGYAILCSVDGGQNWMTSPSSVTRSIVTFGQLSFLSDGVIYSSKDKVVVMNPASFVTDTIHSSKGLMSDVVSGEDVIGIWEGHRANYYRLIGKHAGLVSSIWDIRRPFRNYIPAEIYQYGDVVYTKIIPLTYKARTSLLMSVDRARTWSVINVESDFEKELDAVEPSASDWPMAGYKDKMLSYCVGYKDGKRQDFIKIIRPK